MPQQFTPQRLVLGFIALVATPLLIFISLQSSAVEAQSPPPGPGAGACPSTTTTRTTTAATTTTAGKTAPP